MDSAAEKLSFGHDAKTGVPGQARSFDELYTQHFDFVWRSLRRLGVPPGLTDDAAQDAFVVVHRRLSSLEPEASAKAWLFGIALRVARDYRRAARRKPTTVLDVEIKSSEPSPFDNAAAAQALRTLDRFLATLDEDRRAVFVLAELEELSAPEISAAVGVGHNTVYSRLRVARERFVAFLAEGGSHG